MSKSLNVARIGYGFMGKAHSNAYRTVGNFFPDLEHRPNLKCLCARDAGKADAFAGGWGYESGETDWKKGVERDDIDRVINACDAGRDRARRTTKTYRAQRN